MERIMNKNITLDEYKDIVEKVKGAALKDMRNLNRSEDPGTSGFSMLVLELKCRDPEDYDTERQEQVQLFTDYDSLMEGMIGEEEALYDYGIYDFLEPLRDKFYWRVTRYTRLFERMTVIYSVYFTFDEEIFSVEPDCNFACYFEQYEYVVRQNMPVSASLEYILQSRRQLMLAWNVELPVQPGDRVYVDVRPFKTPFYAVYQAETDECACECSVDPCLTNTGFRILTHPFLSDEGKGGLSKSLHLWHCDVYPRFTEDFNLDCFDGCGREPLEEDIVFPHAPYDRLTTVSCLRAPCMQEKKPLNGVFWEIDGRLLACPFDETEFPEGTAKSGNTYAHRKLWEAVRPQGCNKPYNYYPRGRTVVKKGRRSVIYMSPHINLKLLPDIIHAFGLEEDPEIRTDYSRHYRCHLDQ